MLVPVQLHFHKQDSTLLLNVETERMYDRIAEMLLDAHQGRRKNPVVMSESDMDEVRRAKVSNILPGDPLFDGMSTVKVIGHGAVVRPSSVSGVKP